MTPFKLIASNFIISVFAFILIAILLVPAGNAQALSIDPDYFYRESCPVLSTKDAKTYGPGARGEFVTALQQFLSIEGSYNYGMGPMSWATFTGYYGPITQAAVQDWQAKNGIVSSGSPYATGYGYVGPRTRAAIAQRCVDRNSPVVPQPDITYPTPYNGAIDATQSYSGGKHTITGTVELYNGCYGLETAEVEVRESLPELAILNFTVANRSNPNYACTQAIEYAPFEVDFYASEGARISANVNGQAANFSLDGSNPSLLEITSVEGPSGLYVGDEGTWNLELYGYAGSGVRYNVNWGEPLQYDLVASPAADQGENFEKSKTASFSHVYDTAGTYRITFRVTDSEGNKAVETREVTVKNKYTIDPPITKFKFGELVTINESVEIYKAPYVMTGWVDSEPMGGGSVTIIPASISYYDKSVRHTSVDVAISDYIIAEEIKPGEHHVVTIDDYMFTIYVLGENPDKGESDIIVLRSHVARPQIVID